MRECMMEGLRKGRQGLREGVMEDVEYVSLGVEGIESVGTGLEGVREGVECEGRC